MKRAEDVLCVLYNVNKYVLYKVSSDDEQRKQEPRLEFVQRDGHRREGELYAKRAAVRERQPLHQRVERRASRVVEEPPDERTALARRTTAAAAGSGRELCEMQTHLSAGKWQLI